jgi:tetratricopeptide (TPR) repeat protein
MVLIDLKQELVNYPIIDIDKLIEKEANIPDNIKNSVILYNSAIENIGTNSEDIAVIELKKAVSINPNFYEAMNLLGLCYCYIKEYSKAVAVFRKVVEAENNSVRALKYLSALNRMDDSGNDGKKKKRKIISNITLKKVILSFLYNKNGRFDYLKYVIGFVTGGFLIFLIMFFAMEKPEEIVRVEDIDAVKSRLIEEVDLYKLKYSEVNQNYQKILKDYESLEEEINYHPAKLKLLEIENIYLEGKYEKAADMLILMKNVQFREEDKNKFDLLWEKIMIEAAYVVYEEGVNLCKNEDFDNSLKKLEKVYTYVDSIERDDGVLYWSAKCYQAFGNYTKALELYNRILSDFPESSYVKYVSYRLNEIESSR